MTLGDTRSTSRDGARSRYVLDVCFLPESGTDHKGELVKDKVPMSVSDLPCGFLARVHVFLVNWTHLVNLLCSGLN